MFELQHLSAQTCCSKPNLSTVMDVEDTDAPVDKSWSLLRCDRCNRYWVALLSFAWSEGEETEEEDLGEEDEFRFSGKFLARHAVLTPLNENELQAAKNFRFTELNGTNRQWIVWCEESGPEEINNRKADSGSMKEASEELLQRIRKEETDSN